MNKQIAELKNEALAVRVVIIESNGSYDVAAYDTDSGLMIAVRCFICLQSALAYGAKFVADTIPPGTFVTI
jgi:hypothetical protein